MNAYLYEQMSKMLIASPEFHCSQEILTIVTMLSGRYLCVSSLIGLRPFSQSPTFGYDLTTAGEKLMLRSSC
jgi:HrpA-like RNA helicase